MMYRCMTENEMGGNKSSRGGRGNEDMKLFIFVP